jgi:soluble lytic murein transglycosylase
MLSVRFQGGTITSLRTVLAALILLAPVAVTAKPSAQDYAFSNAREAYQARNKVKLAKAAEKLKGSPLEPYGEFWQLRLRLDGASAPEVHEFLARNEKTVLGDDLRNDWLRLLAKREQWDLFRQDYKVPAGDDPDPEVVCYSLLGRWREGDDTAFGEFLAQWNAAKELPAACVPLAESLMLSGRLETRRIWERIRVLEERGLVKPSKKLLAWLPRDQAVDAGRFSRILDAPMKYLEKPSVDLGTPLGRELAILALSRLARNDPQAAASYWEREFVSHFPEEDHAYVWAMLATHGARNHLPESLDWFVKAGELKLADDQLAWRTRIALRQANWAEVKGSIERMSASAQNEPAWVYWLGRAQAALGKTDEAQALYERLADEYHFYGRLAAEELGHAFEIPPQVTPPTPEELEQVAAVPALQRALALYRLGLRTEGTQEWISGVRGMDDRMLLAASELARRHQMWDRAINTADKTVADHDFTARYAVPFREVFAHHALRWKLEEPWVLGVVRQESRFIADAKSPAGANGLMQLMPSTARWVARQLGIKLSTSKVREPTLNVTLGTYYLKQVLKELEGNPVLAAAAYNAGPKRARKWRDARPLEGAIYAETIPLAETREYVKKVMLNTVYYAAVLSGETRSLKERLGTIAPRPSSAGVMAVHEPSDV